MAGAVRTKRYMFYVCPNCQAEEWIERALMFECPACEAEPGQPCLDLRRRVDGQPKRRVTVHAERNALVT